MTNDIIKAFECCLSGRCAQCPRFMQWRMDAWTCRYGLMKEALDFMERQNETIEILKMQRDEWMEEAVSSQLALDQRDQHWRSLIGFSEVDFK